MEAAARNRACVFGIAEPVGNHKLVAADPGYKKKGNAVLATGPEFALALLEVGRIAVDHLRTFRNQTRHDRRTFCLKDVPLAKHF